MAVENISLGFTTTGYDHEGVNGILFHQYWDAAGAGDRDVRLVFSTMYGTDAQTSFNITLTYDGHRKGGYVGTSPVSRTVNVSPSAANPVERDGRWWWSIPLKTLYAGLTGSSWTYADRTWDGLTLRFSVVCNWPAALWEGLTRSPAVERTCYINYVPTYTLTSAYVNEDGDLGVTYTATDWNRSDDRWAVDEGKIDGVDAFMPVTWGTVRGYGNVVIPKERIRYDLTTGQLYLRLRFNAQWRPDGMEFATISTKMSNTSDPHRETEADPGIKVNDWSKADPHNRAYRANTPSLAAEVIETDDKWALRVRVSDSGDVGKPITHAIVKINGAKYALDMVDVKVGGEGYIWFPPLRMQFSVFAYGLDGNGGVSDTAWAVIDPIEAPGTLLGILDSPSECLVLRHRKDGETLRPSVTVAANTETVQLSGRRRPTVYYGEGGTASVKFTGWVARDIDSVEEANSIDYAASEQPNATAFEMFPESGAFMARFLDGRRYALSASVSIEPDEMGNYKVSVSGDEVET